MVERISSRSQTSAQHPPDAFTLVELLLAIAIIGILSALIVSTVTNAALESREVVARQQQVVLQEALGAWIAANTSGTNSLASARTAFNAASTQGAKLTLLRDYLHPQTYNHFTNFSTTNQIRSEAMQRAGRYIQFSAWASNSTTPPMAELY